MPRGVLPGGIAAEKDRSEQKQAMLSEFMQMAYAPSVGVVAAGVLG